MNESSSSNDASITGPVTALVEFQVRKETTTPDEWLNVWQPRGQDALDAEPSTTAYEAAVSEDHSHNILIFERYTNGDDSIKEHIARPSHQVLNETMAANQMTKRRVMANRLQDIEHYGWWARPDQTPTQRDADLRMTVIGTRFPDEATKQRYIELTGAHADYCRTHEPGTLIYSGGLVLQDAQRGPDLRAGDLVFIAVFANEAAAVQHRDDPRHLALQPELEAIKRERVLLQSYRTSGRGYLWSHLGSNE